MTWNMVHLNDVVPTPWRNGGGTTRELLAWPDPAAWQWRASVAEVVQDGAFSSFAGVKRWFAVLEGEGVCLTVDDQMHMLTTSDQPLAFDGAAVTSCKLLGGLTQDFNLMTQGGATARVLRVRGSFQMIATTPKIIAAYAHKERATMKIGNDVHELSRRSFGWVRVQATTSVHALGDDALLMEIDV